MLLLFLNFTEYFNGTYKKLGCIEILLETRQLLKIEINYIKLLFINPISKNKYLVSEKALTVIKIKRTCSVCRGNRKLLTIKTKECNR